MKRGGIRRLGVVVSCWLLAAAGAATARTYDVVDLGTLGGDWSRPEDLNNSGQVVGAARDASGNYRPFLYSGGGMTDLGNLGGGNSGWAFGINDAGRVVGSATTSTYQDHAFLYSGGGMTDLGTLGAYPTQAFGINASGQIVGISRVSGVDRAFLYSGGTMSSLGPAYGAGLAINDNGQVAWTQTLSGAAHHAVLYNGAVALDLGSLSGGDSSATGLNNEGWVVGYDSGFFNPHAFLYKEGVMTDLSPAVGGMRSWAWGINNHGDVVGTVMGWDWQRRAFLYTAEGEFVDLSALFDGYWLEDAYDVNDSGQIIAYGWLESSNESHAFLLTPGADDPDPDDDPVPEPGTCCLLATGLGGLALGAARRRGKPASS